MLFYCSQKINFSTLQRFDGVRKTTLLNITIDVLKLIDCESEWFQCHLRHRFETYAILLLYPIKLCTFEPWSHNEVKVLGFKIESEWKSFRWQKQSACQSVTDVSPMASRTLVLWYLHFDIILWNQLKLQAIFGSEYQILFCKWYRKEEGNRLENNSLENGKWLAMRLVSNMIPILT